VSRQSRGAGEDQDVGDGSLLRLAMRQEFFHFFLDSGAQCMGLGKTRQAIVGMQVAAPTGMILVVCPASLKLNWRREIKMVDPAAKIEVLGVGDGATN
jgi:hypothetical protein